MDIGTLKDNTSFYEGFEGEPEIELHISDDEQIKIHIWSGYISDIFDEPVFNGKEWTGFTRDYQQETGTYEEQGVIINAEEYLLDLLQYTEKTYRFEETYDCFNLIRQLLEYAISNGRSVTVNWW